MEILSSLLLFDARVTKLIVTYRQNYSETQNKISEGSK